MNGYKVLKNQYVSKNCFVCGLNNEVSLKAKFYEIEGDRVVCIASPKAPYQSYPGRVHGGILGALLDEAMGRVVHIKEEELWGVTAEMTVRYLKPVPICDALYIVCEIVRDTRLFFEAKGTLYLANGEKGATATGKYVKLSDDKIAVDSLFATKEDNDKLYEEEKAEIFLPI